jgi:hypothetical protein
MRFTVFDLLILVATYLPGNLLGLYISHKHFPGKIELVVALLSGFLSYMAITPPLYRWLHLRPLLLPRCPYCHDKDRFYYRPKIQPDWPIGELICAKCGKMVELWYDDPYPTPPDRGLVRFKLLWPYSFGRWRRMPSADKAEKVPGNNS